MKNSTKKLAAGAMAFSLVIGGGASAFAAVPAQGEAKYAQTVQPKKSGTIQQASQTPANAPIHIQWQSMQDKFPAVALIGQRLQKNNPGFGQNGQKGQGQSNAQNGGLGLAPGGQNGQAGQGQFAQGQNPDSIIDVEELAELLSLSEEELTEALRDGSTLAELAEEQDVDTGDLVDSIVSSLTEMLDAQLEEGTIDEDEYDAAVEEAEAFAEKIVEGSHYSVDEELDGTGILSDYTADSFSSNEDLADLLGLTASELENELSNGYTLDELAENNDVDVDDVISLISEQITAELDDRLDEEELTEDEYNAALDSLNDYVSDLVSGEL